MLVEKKRMPIPALKKSDRDRLWLVIGGLTIFSSLFFLVGISSCNRQKEAELKSKTNSAPVITSVTLLPEKPNKESELNLVIRSQDPDGDPVIYQYQWMKNDEEIIGENKDTLKGGSFKKGDLIRVKVTPSDGKIDGKPFLSESVKILNSPPLIQEVRIEPKMASARDHLKAIVRSLDADGDFVYYSYQWERNGSLLNEEKAETLERARFKKGDLITVTVTPDDRETQGFPKKSEPVIISNSPPVIISSPPTSTEGTAYSYNVKANDPDDDPILFSLKSAPKGMEVDKDTGLIRWQIRREDKGPHLIEIEASDNSGAKSVQRYTLKVEFR
jgi:hypothetical protein